MVGANLAQLWTWRINTEDQPTNRLKLSPPNNHFNERNLSTWNMGLEWFLFLYKDIFNTFLFCKIDLWFFANCPLHTFPESAPIIEDYAKNSILIIWASANSLETKKNRTQDFQFLQACYLKIFEVCPVLVLRSSEQVEKYVRNSGETLQPTS